MASGKENSIDEDAEAENSHFSDEENTMLMGENPTNKSNKKTQIHNLKTVNKKKNNKKRKADGQQQVISDDDSVDFENVTKERELLLQQLGEQAEIINNLKLQVTRPKKYIENNVLSPTPCDPSAPNAQNHENGGYAIGASSLLASSGIAHDDKMTTAANANQSQLSFPPLSAGNYSSGVIPSLMSQITGSFQQADPVANGNNTKVISNDAEAVLDSNLTNNDNFIHITNRKNLNPKNK